MPVNYVYEVWKGKKLLGQVESLYPVKDGVLEYYVSKNKKLTVIYVAVETKVVSDDGMTIVSKRYVDVTRKSKQQIDSLLSQYGCAYDQK